MRITSSIYIEFLLMNTGNYRVDLYDFEFNLHFKNKKVTYKTVDFRMKALHENEIRKFNFTFEKYYFKENTTDLKKIILSLVITHDFENRDSEYYIDLSEEEGLIWSK